MTAQRTDPGTSRRAVVAGGAALGLLGALAACTGDEEEGQEDWASLGERPSSIGDLIARPDPLDPEDPRGLECSVGGIVVTASSRRDAFEPREAAAIRGEDEEPEEPVTAPEGEQFLIVTLDQEHALWALPEQVPLPRARFVVRRPDGERAFPMDPDKTSGTWIVRVAADPAPEDAVLEIVELGRTQRLSLIDGSLVHTDVPYLYERTRLAGEAWPSGGVTLTGEQAPEAEGQVADDGHGYRDEIQLQALAARDVPLSRTLGWAAGGEQLLRLEVDAWQRFVQLDGAGSVNLPLDLSGSVLRLPDGTDRQPAAVADARHQQDLVHASSTVILWFSVPVDLTAAEVHVFAAPFPRRKGLAEELAASCSMTIPLTLEPRR